MRMMAIGVATMGALIAGASPAAAQKADPDALCLVAVIISVGRLEEQRATMPPDQVQQTSRLLDGALTFYSGALLARVVEPQIKQTIASARADFTKLTTLQQGARAANCVQAVGQALDKIVPALGD